MGGGAQGHGGKQLGRGARRRQDFEGRAGWGMREAEGGGRWTPVALWPGAPARPSAFALNPPLGSLKPQPAAHLAPDAMTAWCTRSP
jgi:hypothetical protein